MKKLFAVLVVFTLIFVLTPREAREAAAQTLSDQVLLLLSRANTWTALQTFDDVTITGTCTGCGGAGGGTVTSVASTVDTELDTIISLSGSPITGSGTLAFTLDSQSANIVLAGPSSGGATDPTFRALVDDDVPDTITIDGTNNVTWASVNKTGSDSADLVIFDVDDVTAGTLALANLTDGGTAGIPLVAGGGGGDPNYAAIDVSTAAVTGQLVATSFPALTGDITTAGGALATTLSNTGVSAATYGSSSAVGQFTVDAKGRITAASNVTIATANLLSTTYCADCAADAATQGSILYGNASNEWDELTVGAANTALFSDGTDVAWGTDGTGLDIDVDNATAGDLALNRGGTAASLTAAAGGAVYSTASALAITAAGTTGECLISQGASAPIWDTCATAASHALLSATHSDTAAASVSRGSIIYGNSTPEWAELTVGASGTFLRSDGTDVSWGTDGSALTNLDASTISAGTLGAARGGTGISSFAVGDLLYAGTTTTLSKLAAVASGQVLTSAGAGVAPAWSASPAVTSINATGTVVINGKMLISATAPTISSGFGSSPSIDASNGTAAIRILTGTGSFSSGVIGLPTAANGWVCHVKNLTAQAANRADRRTVQTATSTTSATFQNQTISTGAALNFTASDVLLASCFAY